MTCSQCSREYERRGLELRWNFIGTVVRTYHFCGLACLGEWWRSMTAAKIQGASEKGTDQ